MNHRSLRRRFLLIAIPLTAAVAVIIVTASYLGFGARMRKELDTRARLLSSALAESTGLRLAMFDRNAELATTEVARYEALDDQIQYLIVLDDSGAVLTARAGRAWHGAAGSFNPAAHVSGHGSEARQSNTLVHHSVDVLSEAEVPTVLDGELMGLDTPPAEPRKLGRVLISLDGGQAFASQLTPVAASGVMLPVAVLIVVMALFGRILRRLTAMVDYARTVATGDLAQRLNLGGDDELGELAGALNQMAENLSSLLARVAAVTEELRLVIEKISHSATGVAKGSDQQWSALESARAQLTEMAGSLRDYARNVDAISQWTRESSDDAKRIGERNTEVTGNLDRLARASESMSASVEQVGGNVSVLARHVDVLTRASGDTEETINRTERALQSARQLADSSSKIADQVAQEARSGAEAVNSSLGAMATLEGAMTEVKRSTSGLTDRIETIAVFLRGIADVARRTNLLSLNAAIIASQAGEHGRQFQVVAEEVKALASQTAGLTLDIEGVLGEINATSGTAHRAVDDANASVAEGTRQVERTGEVLHRIMGATDRSAQMSQEIAGAMAERESDLARVTRAMEHVVAVTAEIHKVTQTQLSAVEAMREAAGTIHSVADTVKRSTAEQLAGSTRISEVLADISDNVGKLSSAQGAQVRGGDRILETVEEVRRVADKSRDEAQSLEQTIEVLALQADELRAEMERFVLQELGQADRF